MDANLASGAPGFQRHRASSVFCRLAQVYGVAKPKTAAELYRRSCERVALGNEVYLDAGHTEVVITHMATVDASLAPRFPVDLPTALHEAELADCDEQRPDETFRFRLTHGTATVEDAREYVRRSSMQRHKAEVAERAALLWIQQQEAP